jgi:hypothetical protein
MFKRMSHVLRKHEIISYASVQSFALFIPVSFIKEIKRLIMKFSFKTSFQKLKPSVDIRAFSELSLQV